MNQLNAYKSSSKLQWLFVLWVCLISVNPFVFSNAIEYFPNKLVFVSSIVLMLMLLVMKGRIILGDKVIITILLVQTVFSPVYALVHMDINYINIASHAIVFLLVYICFV